MDAEMRKFLNGVVGVVEATHYEMFALWGDNDRQRDDRKLEWSGNTEAGIGVQFGKLGKMPVCGTLWPKKIAGHKILFVELTSTVVDHRIVEAWLKENMPVTAFEDCDPRKRLNQYDANNFRNVFSEPRRRAERLASQESER